SRPRAGREARPRRRHRLSADAAPTGRPYDGRPRGADQESTEMTDASDAVNAQTTTGTTQALSPMRYLDKAMTALRDLGLIRDGATTQEAPIVALLQQISDLDEERVVAITRTLSRSEEHTSELQSRENLVCRLLLEKKK